MKSNEIYNLIKSPVYIKSSDGVEYNRDDCWKTIA